MQTIKQLEKEKQEIIKAAGDPPLSTKENAKLGRLLACNLKLQAAVRVGWSDDYIKSELSALKSKIAKIESRYLIWLKNSNPIEYGKNPKTTYSKLTNLPYMRSQVKFMTDLLD